MKYELGEKIMTKFVGLRAKKRHKKVCHEKENLSLKIIKTI